MIFRLLVFITTRTTWHGTSSTTPIHFTFVKEKLPPDETVFIAERALTADTVVRFRPNARVIATSGVAQANDASCSFTTARSNFERLCVNEPQSYGTVTLPSLGPVI